MDSDFNSRILVIDDEENVRDSIRAILVPSRQDTSAMEEAAARLFDDAPAPERKRADQRFAFQVDTAAGGREGYELVRRAAEGGAPYAAVFVDMRMPDWDGLATAQHIREVDTKVEIIFVTAYSDHTIEDVVARAGANVSYHCKPFSSEELSQLAIKSVYEWNKTRDLEGLIGVIAGLRSGDMRRASLLREILAEAAGLLGVESALLAVPGEEDYHAAAGLGGLVDPEAAAACLAAVDLRAVGDMQVDDRYARFALNDHRIVVSLEDFSRRVPSERFYLVRLFLDQAAQVLENSRLQEELLRSEKLSAVGGAVSMIAHDLRDKLGGMHGMADFLLSDNAFSDQSRQGLRTIRDAAGECNDYVNDLMDFVRRREIDFDEEPVVIADLLEMVRSGASETARKAGVALTLDIRSDFAVPGSRRKLERALANLVKNAVEAFRGSRTAEPQVTVRSEERGAGGRITVEDNGPGIPPDVRDTLFEPFVTAGKAGGTGLGLAIVKQIAEAHNAAVTVESGPGGTRFVLTFPDLV